MTAAQRAVDEWNRSHPVGTPVTIILDSGDLLDTTITTPAYVANSGHAVIHVDGIAGFYILDRVRPRGKAGLG